MHFIKLYNQRYIYIYVKKNSQNKIIIKMKEKLIIFDFCEDDLQIIFEDIMFCLDLPGMDKIRDEMDDPFDFNELMEILPLSKQREVREFVKEHLDFIIGNFISYQLISKYSYFTFKEEINYDNLLELIDNECLENFRKLILDNINKTKSN